MPTRTLFARAETSSAQNSGKGAPDTSFFTFLVALLILAFASAALILRALILRRRFRNRLQAAIDAGLIPRQAIPEQKPEFYEAYVRGVESGAKSWASVMPLTAAELNSHDDGSKVPTSTPTRYRPSLAGRLMELLGHRPPLQVVATDKAASNDSDTTTTRSHVQLAVLIAMPSEYPMIPSIDDDRGKQRESVLAEEGMPDVLFGVSSLPVARVA